MNDHTKIKIANAFYSKSRGMFLPLTVDDILHRTKLNPDVADHARISMLLTGYMATTRVKGEALYDLTATGKALVEVAL